MFLFYILEWEGNFSLYCFLLKTESGKQLLLKYNSHAKRSKFLEMLKSISKVKPNFMTNTSVRWKVKNVHACKQCTLQVIYVICQKRGRVLYHWFQIPRNRWKHEAAGRVLSSVSRYLEPVMKHEARVFDILHQGSVNFYSLFFSLNWSTGFKFFFENAMRSNRVLRSEIKATKCIVFFDELHDYNVNLPETS